MSIQCHGKVVNETSENFGKRCSLLSANSYCQYHKFQANNKDIVVERVKKYLGDVANVDDKDNKRTIIVQEFDYLLDNILFVHQYDTFKVTLLAKLDELEPDWSDAPKYKTKFVNALNKLDNLKPSDKIKDKTGLELTMNSLSFKHDELQKDYDKAEVVDYVKIKLAECDQAVGKDNKRNIVIAMFDYLLINSKFVYDHDKFKVTLMKKLDELEPDWSDSPKYKKRLENLMDRYALAKVQKY